MITQLRCLCAWLDGERVVYCCDAHGPVERQLDLPLDRQAKCVIHSFHSCGTPAASLTAGNKETQRHGK